MAEKLLRDIDFQLVTSITLVYPQVIFGPRQPRWRRRRAWVQQLIGICNRTSFHYIACMETPPVVLTIAGFDPSSGAGVTADVKTIAAHGCYGVSCVQALTLQLTAGVRRVETVNETLIAEMLDELSSDIEISAVHIGMLGSGKAVRVVSDFLAKAELSKVVLDPIMRSSSGAHLIDAKGVRLLIERLLPLATVVTPNLDEASALTGLAVTNVEQMSTAATKLHAGGADGAVITGEHREKAIDLLSFPSRRGVE